MSNIDPDQLLDLYRRMHEPTPAVHAEVRDAIIRRIEAGDPGLTLLPAGAGIGRRALGLLGLGGVIALAGVGLGWGLSERRAQPGADTSVERPALPKVTQLETEIPAEPARAADSATPEPATPEPALEREPRTEPELEPKNTEPAQLKKTSGASRHESSPSPAEPESAPAPAPASTLRAEMALLSKGRRSMRDARFEDALRTFEAHRDRFPVGELAEEREVHRHEALCRLGRLAEASELRASFARSYADSPHKAKVERGCKEGSP